MMTSDGIENPIQVPAIANGSFSIKSPYFSEPLHNWDSRWSLQIHKIGQRIPRFILQALEYSGDGLLWIPITAALCWAPDFILQRFCKGLLIGFVFDLMVIGAMKALIRRPRPVYNKGMYVVMSVDHYSFPSGHASRAFLIFIFVVKYAAEWEATFFQASMAHADAINGNGSASGHLSETLGYYYLIPLIFACWAMVTASSRIFLGRHFLLDVVVGSFLGALEALFVIRTLLPLQFFLDEQQLWLLEHGHSLKEAVLKLL